ncbi:MAG: class I SAM-dependent methyltransferase [Proteobacteria bacterium]|nr:class I SAM-dependent methyltransferase [Pseudomonadota bacterium]
MSEVRDSDAAALANRLRKNARHLARWARREALEAYRLYDRDIPEFPYAIDIYADWLHVQLFEGKRPVTDHDIAAHLAAIGAALDVPRERIALKLRRRQRGSSQYEKLADDGPSFTVRERGHLFEVNLTRYLDSGLFLDHRDTRRMVAAAAPGKRVLNLFAYTGSFTVYAACAGAERTVTVDMSHTYQDWTARNLRLNGIDDFERHRLVTEDVMAWLGAATYARERYDVIVLDPPSFSNSKRMQDSFDVQRDQAPLLAASVRLLAPGGVLYFSNNRQGFKLDAEVARLAHFEDITARTVPEDFKRRPPHRCWRVTRA